MTMIDFLETWNDDLSGHDKDLADAARQQAEASMAGLALRRLQAGRRQLPPRRWTGRIGHGRRGFVGQAVVLPDRTLGKLLAARRGWAAVAWVDPFAVRSRRIGYVEAGSVQPFRHPAAVALGRLKAGRREKPSAAKARACRRNSVRLPRKASRPRGRPRKQPPASFSEQAQDAVAASR